MKFAFKHLLATSLFALAAQTASAVDVITFGGTGSTGVSFVATVTYDATAEHELIVQLTNTTATAGGYLTGFAFDLPGNEVVTLFSSPRPAMTLQADASTAPYGTRDWAAAVGGNWLGGGAPRGGLAVGTSGTWTFDVAQGPATLSFDDLDMVVRFRGLANGGSDKVTAVPEPESYALMLAGLGVLGFVARRRRQG